MSLSEANRARLQKASSFLDIPKMVYEYYVNELGKPVKNR